MVAPFLSSAVEITWLDSCGREFGRAAEHAGPPIFQHDDVLDADTAPTGQIDARFNGKHHAVFEDILGAEAEVWRFVHLQADAVAETVAEALAVASTF